MSIKSCDRRVQTRSTRDYPRFLLAPNMASHRTHTRVNGAPDYDDPHFWDARFATGQDVGEWLNSGEALIDAVLSDLEHQPSFDGQTPRVLHLGPGVSKLGPKLRDACAQRQWKGRGIVVSWMDNQGCSLFCAAYSN
jgi:hypothetical protein